MKRKGWVFWVVAAIQVSAACCWLCNEKATLWLLWLTFNSRKSHRFHCKAAEISEKSTFTSWILDKLQFYFICTQMLNPPPVQGCGLLQPQAGCALKKLHTWIKNTLETFSFCLEWTPEQHLWEVYHCCSSVHDQRPHWLCVEAVFCQGCPCKKAWQAHTQLGFGHRMNEKWAIECLARGKQRHSTSSFGLVPK